tara:strand:- start:2202 stop:3200 length:999 start_codon:yes stop_codon:yes gene_type:complete
MARSFKNENFSMKKAFITGINGQDGSYLCEHLIDLGYEVFGMVRRQSVAENQSFRIEKLNHKITTFYGDINDEKSIWNILENVCPDEIYNLAAMSHVRISFEVPSYTLKTNGLGVLNLLEAYKHICPKAKFYQASSSEMFGNSIDSDGFQRLTTPMNPTSPYGCAKVLAYNLVNHYRNAYNLHACNGILFNHESPRRGINFVTNKIVKGAVEIKKGLRNKLALGNLDSSRDWGHSYDYVRAMHLIVNNGKARNWIVSSGQNRSVRDLCEYVFETLGLNYMDFIIQEKKYLRPEELKYLKGDSSETRELLGWKPFYSFETMIQEMIDSWMKKI